LEDARVSTQGEVAYNWDDVRALSENIIEIDNKTI
jgi:hypothetical protein